MQKLFKKKRINNGIVAKRSKSSIYLGSGHLSLGLNLFNTKIETYTRHLNHKTYNKCFESVPDNTTELWVTQNTFLAVTKLDV